MPKDIVAAHPLLQFDNLTHYQTVFYTHGQTYQNYVDDVLGTGGDFGERVGVGLQ